MSDQERILDLLISRAQMRVDGQLRDSDAADAKALGVLGADAAAIGLLVATHDRLNSLWWAPTVALGLAALLLLAAVWPRRFDIGPDTRSFYEMFGAASYQAAALQMLSDLLAAADRNDKKAPSKSVLFKSGLLVLLIGLGGAVAVGLAR